MNVVLLLLLCLAPVIRANSVQPINSNANFTCTLMAHGCDMYSRRNPMTMPGILPNLCYGTYRHDGESFAFSLSTDCSLLTLKLLGKGSNPKVCSTSGGTTYRVNSDYNQSTSCFSFEVPGLYKGNYSLSSTRRVVTKSNHFTSSGYTCSTTDRYYNQYESENCTAENWEQTEVTPFLRNICTQTYGGHSTLTLLDCVSTRQYNTSDCTGPYTLHRGNATAGDHCDFTWSAASVIEIITVGATFIADPPVPPLPPSTPQPRPPMPISGALSLLPCSWLVWCFFFVVMIQM
eukprot:TRINITY_DN68183_c5_g7_i1.p1 TRINITY_DN68183_c5_g7~~TRINITY_DN68183_c5_g7_i1.p1  ORF type:complete len:300 (-),score=8.49 TRINITY_DN68183_c5_g7_i1:201-1070(-)